MPSQAQSLVVIIVNAFAISTGLRWTSFDIIPPGSFIKGCQEENITLPWRYETEGSEHVIFVEWFFQDNSTENKTALASYVMENFMTTPGVDQEVSYLPNAGLVLRNITGKQSGRYTVQINLSLRGSIVTDAQSVNVDITESQCSDSEFETASLRKQLDQLRADNDVLRQQITNITALYNQTLNASCTDKPRNCVDILKLHRASGVYTIYLSDDSPLQVYCDQDTDSGGWIVIQRRQDGSVSFNRLWKEYEDGFGNLTGEFWLGLSRIHQLSAKKNCRLRVDLTDWNGDSAYALYDNFYVDGADDKYRLHVGEYQGTAGNALNTNSSFLSEYLHNGMAFSTSDNDNDHSYDNCGARYKSGWWFNHCFATNLNGIYKQNQSDSSSVDNQTIAWYDWHLDWRSYKHAEMKIKL